LGPVKSVVALVPLLFPCTISHIAVLGLSTRWLLLHPMPMRGLY
jgi:hypothetical protein